MTLLPVVERELRTEARGAFTYWLRVGGGVALLCAGAVFLTDNDLGHNLGGRLFRMMHVTLFFAVWIVAALMTADCISRERREGTLGLLFLTPLRPFDVVLAKSMAHGLRAAGVALAAVPVMVVPFLMGGVGWREALASVLINFNALCGALAAGVLASSFCKTLTRALVLTAILGVGAYLVVGGLIGAGLITATGNWGPRRLGSLSLEDLVVFGLRTAMNPSHVMEWAGRAGTTSAWLFTLAVNAGAAFILFLFVALLAARAVRRAARDKTPSPALQLMEKQFCTPAFGLGFYRKWMRRILERNPVGWLERRTWQGRLVTWSWLAVMISLLSWMLAGVGTHNRDEITGILTVLGWLLVGNVALTAAGSLRRERETGVIELLLVSPLSPEQIIGGRLRGIAGQFLPAAALLFGSWLWLLHALKGVFLDPDAIAYSILQVWFFVVALLTVSVVGLYFSLRCRMFVVALFWTAVAGVVAPSLAANFAGWLLHWVAMPRTASCMMLAVLNVAGIALLWRTRTAGVQGLTGLLALACAVSLFVALIGGAYLTSRDDDPMEVVAFLSFSLFQITLAAWLATRLRRRLEQRKFALPQ